MTTSEDYFNKINTIDDINGIVAEHWDEDLHIDFKGVDSLNTKEYKKIYAEAISGFANSDGGVIVWGVDCRKNSDGIDCADTLKPIKSLRLFVSRLKELQTRLVDPLIDRMDHKMIEDGTHDDEGYAVSYIPYEYNGPYMAKGGMDRYFRRSGDTFARMEHYEIKSSFFRELFPDLELKTKIFVKSKTSEFKYRIKIIISIFNKGRGIAKYPFLSLLVQHPHKIDDFGLDGNRNHGLQRMITSNMQGWISFTGSSNDVIYPGFEKEITAIPLDIDCKMGYPQQNDVQLSYILIAESFMPFEGVHVICNEEIEKMLKISY